MNIFDPFNRSIDIGDQVAYLPRVMVLNEQCTRRVVVDSPGIKVAKVVRIEKIGDGWGRPEVHAELSDGHVAIGNFEHGGWGLFKLANDQGR